MAKSRPRKSLPDRDQKRLWGKAAARCSYESCRRKLIREFPETGETAVIGQHAHQKPHSPQGPRGLKGDDKPWEQPIDPTGPATYENTILVCGSCHTTIDQAPKAHPVELLAAMKLRHERWVQRRLERKRAKSMPPVQGSAPGIRVVIQEESRKVGTTWLVVRRPNPFARSAMRGELPQPRRPRVRGCESGPPQTIFKVTIINQGSRSLQMKDFRLAVDGVPLSPVGTSILYRSLSEAFKEPLDPHRAQEVVVKAHHVAKKLREQGMKQPVRLTFTFVDVCLEEFSEHIDGFDPMKYEDTPDTVPVNREWEHDLPR